MMFCRVNNCGVYFLRRNVLKITQLWNLSYTIFSFNLIMSSEAIMLLIYICEPQSLEVIGFELGHIFGGESTHIKKV